MIVVTDSAADLPKEEARQYNIQVAPLFIQFPEGEVSSEDLTPDEFYNRLRAMEPHIPSTSQPSSGSFSEIYRKAAALKEEILSIHISSGLSGTIQSARTGASQVDNADVCFVDSMTLSGGERFQVLAAAMAAKLGWGREAIVEHLKKVRESTEIIYTLETLTYLARGGRIGRVQALAGSILKLKPLIKVEKSDGKYSTVGKERTMPRALESICNYLEHAYGPETPLWVSVLHGQFEEQALKLEEILKGRLNVAYLEVLRISPVLGVHTGPGVVGAAAVPYELMKSVQAS